METDSELIIFFGKKQGVQGVKAPLRTFSSSAELWICQNFIKSNLFI